MAVAAHAGTPRNILIAVGEQSSITKPLELKGKTISMTTAGSLTYWLTQRVSIEEAFGTYGIKVTTLGVFQPSLAALCTHQIDGMMAAIELGDILEATHAGPHPGRNAALRSDLHHSCNLRAPRAHEQEPESDPKFPQELLRLDHLHEHAQGGYRQSRGGGSPRESSSGKHSL